MKKIYKLKTMIALFLTLCLAITLVSMKNALPQKNKPWIVPEKFLALKNPVKSSDDNIQAGETLYRKNCVSCHGKTGSGDGIKAKNLDSFPGDFTTSDFQSESDGSVFYKSKFGRNEMPKYENKIEDNDIWTIITYIRTLRK